MKLRLNQVHICDNGSSFNGKICDLLIEGGIITAIAPSSSKKIKTPKGYKEINLSGKYLSPAFADLRADFCDPGFEHKETLSTGAAAAMEGGFSDVALLPSTEPNRDNKAAVQYVFQHAKSLAIDLHPYGTATVAREGKEMADLFDMQQAGAIGFTDGNRPIKNAGLLLRLLQYNQIFNGLLLSYPLEPSLSSGGQMHEGKVSTLLGLKGIPAVAEEAAILRDLEVLKYTEGRLHFSCISSKGSVDLIRKAKRVGLLVSCDVAVANLCFTEEQLVEYETNFKLMPPLRSKQDQKALWEGIADGTIDAICSNHQPQAIEDKEVEFDYAAYGMITLPWVLPLLLAAKPATVNLSQLVASLSIHPRKVLGLPAIAIESGNTARLVCFDLDNSKKYNSQASKSANYTIPAQSLKGGVNWIISNNTLYPNQAK